MKIAEIICHGQDAAPSFCHTEVNENCPYYECNWSKITFMKHVNVSGNL